MKRQPRPEPAAAAAEVARLGEELRDARMALGISIAEVSETLRIRRVYIQALEEGRARDLPAPAYAVGFVRTYAKALGLDDDDMVRRFREGTGSAVPRKPDLVFPEPVPERGVPAGALVLTGAVVVIAAYIGWWNWSGSGERVVDAVPPPPPRLQDLAAVREPPAAEPPAAPTPAPLPPTQAAAAPAPTLPAPTLPARPGAPAVAPGTPPVAAPTPAVAPAPRPDEPRVVLRARTTEVWVQVRERANGPIIVDRVLKPGESYAVANREPPAVLNTGNAPQLEVMVDGQALAAGLGAGPNSRRGQSLDPEKLKAIPAAAVPASAPAARPATPAAAPTPNAAPAGQTTAAQAPARPAAPPAPASAIPAPAGQPAAAAQPSARPATPAAPAAQRPPAQ